MDPFTFFLCCLNFRSLVAVAAIYAVAYAVIRLAENKDPHATIGEIAFPLAVFVVSIYGVFFLANLATYEGPEIGRGLAFIIITLLWSSLLSFVSRLHRLFGPPVASAGKS